MGPTLARPRPVRRDQQLRARRREAERLAVSRLRDPLVQRRQAVRPIPARAVGRRRATRRRAGWVDRHRLLSFGALGRRAGRPRTGPLRRTRRHRGDHRPGVPGDDRRLCPLPRPQARPDPAERLLPPAVVLPEHQPLPQRRPHRRGHPPRRRRREAGVRASHHRDEPPAERGPGRHRGARGRVQAGI